MCGCLCDSNSLPTTHCIAFFTTVHPSIAFPLSLPLHLVVGWYAFTEFGDALWADFNDGCSYDDIIAKYPNLPPGLGDDDDDDDEDDEDDEDEDDE